MIKKKDRSLLPYGDSTLAPSFTSTDKEVARWKDDKNKNSDDYFKTKASEIEAEYNKLKEDFNMNEMINSATIMFKPLVGEHYYLYKRIEGDRGAASGSTMLSLVSPKEYGENYTKNLDFIGCFKIDSHDVWKQVEYEESGVE